MSTLEADPEVGEREPEVDIRPMGSVVTRARIAQVGALSVRRLLPLRDRRTVGAWCFIDHYGPMSVDAGPGMHVPPHPHIGLQTASPARAYSEIVGVDITVRRDRDDELPLSPGFEYALLATLGSANVDGALLEPGKMLYVSPGREAVSVRSATGSRSLLLGGKPFAEKIMMWWNLWRAALRRSPTPPTRGMTGGGSVASMQTAANGWRRRCPSSPGFACAKRAQATCRAFPRRPARAARRCRSRQRRCAV